MIFFLIALTIFGIVCLALPHAFTGKPDHIRLSGIGILIFLVHSIFGMFPKGMQIWIVRLMGVGMMGLAGFMGFLVYGPEGRAAESAPAVVASSEAEPAPETGGIAAGMPGQSPAMPGQTVVLPGGVEQVIPAGTGAGTGAETVPAAVPANAPGVPAAAGEKPSLEEADRQIQHASSRWASGDTQGAITHAEEALRIRLLHYGAEHPKVAEVRTMLATARANLNQNTATAGR